MSSFENDYLSARSNEYSAEVKLSHTWDLPLVGVEVGLAAGGALLDQTFRSPASPPARRGAATHFSVNLGASLDIAAGVYGVAELAAQSYAFSLQRSSEQDPEWAASLAYRQYVGLGKYW